MYKNIVVLLISIFFLNTLIHSQSSSYQIKTIAGKNYILYPVEPGEGLFSVSRKFKVSINELVQYNPEAANGLKPGQILLVPQSVVDSAQPTPKRIHAVTHNQITLKEHEVSKKQTLFSICKKYDLTVEELMKHNPELKAGLKTGMILKIPVSANQKDKASLKEKEKEKKPALVTLKHIVQAKETLYAISKTYNISIDQLIIQNPELAKGLFIGMELAIQVEKSVADSIVSKQSQKLAESKTVVDIENLLKINKNSVPNKKPYRIALLLPLIIENSKADAVNERFQEFYAGFLLAANEAKKSGISLEIHTFDTGRTEEKVLDVLQNSILKQVDLLIGPAYSNQIPFVAEFARTNRIHTIIPFSSRVTEIDTNPFLLQFNPSQSIEVDFLSDILTRDYSNENILFVQLSGTSATEYGNTFIQKLQSKLKANNQQFRVIDFSTTTNGISADLFDVSKKNIVIFNTDKYSSIFPHLALINNLSSQFDILLYEQYSWKNQNANFRFKSFSLAPFKPELTDTDFKTYQNLFDTHFNWRISTRHPRFDVLGYDLGHFVIAKLYSYGKDFAIDKLQLPMASGIQSFIKFERASIVSGFENTQLYRHDN